MVYMADSIHLNCYRVLNSDVLIFAENILEETTCFKMKIQSTLIISKSTGLSETLRDSRFAELKKNN